MSQVAEKAAEAARGLAKQAAHCAEMCAKEDRPDCARICRDTADVSRLLADFLARDAHGVVGLTQVAKELARDCVAECERHSVDHCQETARVARAAVAAFSAETRTTDRTPAGERL